VTCSKSLAIRGRQDWPPTVPSAALGAFPSQPVDLRLPPRRVTGSLTGAQLALRKTEVSQVHFVPGGLWCVTVVCDIIPLDYHEPSSTNPWKGSGNADCWVLTEF
jgi:hypothetical protein